MLLYEVAQDGVAGVDELVGCQPTLVAQARVGAGLEHHLDEGAAKVALGLGLGVEPADGRVERRVALEAVDGVAFKVWLVEEEVDDFVWEGVGRVSGGMFFLFTREWEGGV